MSQKASTKRSRTCVLCGVRFFSNKKLYCEHYHARVWNSARKSPKLPALLNVLIEREDVGARIEGFWASVLEEMNWLEDADWAGYKRLSAWGKSRVKLLEKERRK